MRFKKVTIEFQIPLGVILAIPPFNYPVNLAISKISHALIEGNSIILKPPTQGVVSTLHMVHCFHLVGFPKGLINCVTDKGSEIVDFLTMHPRVNCIRDDLTIILGVAARKLHGVCRTLGGCAKYNRVATELYLSKKGKGNIDKTFKGEKKNGKWSSQPNSGSRVGYARGRY